MKHGPALDASLSEQPHEQLDSRWCGVLPNESSTVIRLLASDKFLFPIMKTLVLTERLKSEPIPGGYSLFTLLVSA
jgi:hypothetical protein